MLSQQFSIPRLLHKCSRQLIIHKETSYAITQNVTSASMFSIWNLEMLSPDITANVPLVTLFYDKNILVAKLMLLMIMHTVINIMRLANILFYYINE